MFSLINLIIILVSAFIFSVEIVFPELRSSEKTTYIEIITLLFIILEIIVNLSTIKQKSGKKIQTLI